MTEENPGILAGRLATIENEQKNTTAAVSEIAREQKTQGRALERLVAAAEVRKQDRIEQRERCASHSSRIRDLEAYQARLDGVPEEVERIRETVGKRGLLAAAIGAISTGLVLAAKYLITVAKAP